MDNEFAELIKNFSELLEKNRKLRKEQEMLFGKLLEEKEKQIELLKQLLDSSGK